MIYMNNRINHKRRAKKEKNDVVELETLKEIVYSMKGTQDQWKGKIDRLCLGLKNSMNKSQMWSWKTYRDTNTDLETKEIFLCRENIGDEEVGVWVMRVDWVYKTVWKGEEKIYSGIIHMLWKKEREHEPIVYDYSIQQYNEEVHTLEFSVVKSGGDYQVGIKIVDIGKGGNAASQYCFQKV